MMHYSDGIKDLSHKRSTRYVLTGAEPYLKESFVKEFKTHNPDYTVFFFYPDSEKEALSFINSQDLFGKYLIVLYDFDKFHVDKVIEDIKEFSGFIFLVLSEKADLRSRSVSKLVSLCTHVECPKLKEYGTVYPSWVAGEAKRSGYNFIDGAEEILYNRVGPNLYALANELKKLFYFTHDRKVISPVDVDKVSSFRAVSSNYAIFECLLKKDSSGLFKNMTSFNVEESLSDFVYFLESYLEKMLRMVLLHEKKIGTRDIADIIGIPEFLVKSRYLPWSLSMGRATLFLFYDKVIELESRLRKFKGDKKVLLDFFLFKIINDPTSL